MVRQHKKVSSAKSEKVLKVGCRTGWRKRGIYMTQKKSISLAGIILGFLLLLFSATTVHAATNPLAQMPRKDREVLNRAVFAKGGNYVTPEYSSKMKIKVSSSNTKIATVKGHVEWNSYSHAYYAWYEVTPLSPGTTKIKCSVTVNKKTYTKTCAYTVYKWENPFKSLKIGSVNYQPCFNKKGVYETRRKTISGKFVYKLNKDFSLIKAEACYYTDPTKKYLTKYVNLKNGQKLPKNTVSISIKAKSRKTKQDIYSVMISVPVKYRY